MAKVEEHRIGGNSMRVCVHRKGATRAFGPGCPGVASEFSELGQPVLIPGSMGHRVLHSARHTRFDGEGPLVSTCHGAGRVMSRATVRGERLRQELQSRAIVVRAGSMSGLAEEAPVAYKDVTRVVEVVERAGIGRKLARLEPIAVIKG